METVALNAAGHSIQDENNARRHVSNATASKSHICLGIVLVLVYTSANGETNRHETTSRKQSDV
jgi:hypothetical protein